MLQRVRLGTHHLSDLQHDEAVERRHAQGAVLLPAQFDGSADLWHFVVSAVVLGVIRRDVGTQETDDEVVGIRADALEEFVGLELVEAYGAVLLCLDA